MIALYHQGIGMAEVKQTTKTERPQLCHTEICEPGINKSTMRKPRLPQPGASRSQSAAARATFSQIVRYDPKAGDDKVIWHMGKRK